VNVIEATGLGKRYGNSWALRECSLAVPEGHVVALVGPNGAGKTTLLNLVVGLTAPTAGSVTVLGGVLPGSPVARNATAFVAQNAPLHQNLSVTDVLHLTRNLNRHFDLGYAKARLGELGIPLKRKAGKLSGGQQAQLALTLALSRRPRLLVLDEPMASLDPLARHDFMASVLAATAEDGVSVVLSSHVLAELERVADYLVILTRGRVQVVGEVDDLLASHLLASGPDTEADCFAESVDVVHALHSKAQTQFLIRTDGSNEPVPPGWKGRSITLEELAMAYLREPSAASLPGPSRAQFAEPTEVAQ
jgi:ABC-2 type transport system ATP-binding protein